MTRAKLKPQPQLAVSTTSTEYDPVRLSRETSDHAVVARFAVPGEPVSKARARFTNYRSPGRMYTPQKTLDAEREVAARFRSAAGPGEISAEATYGLMAVFHHGTRQRRDVDNMLKLLLDGLNKVAWADDNQVTEVSGRKEFAGSKDAAFTEVVVYRIGLMNHPTRICTACGKSYRTYVSWPKKNHCSDDCRMATRRAERRRTCEHCGLTWDPGKPSDARFCSKACVSAHQRVEMACSHCGTTFTKARSYIRKMNYCSDECARLANNLRRTKLRKGDCTECGGPVSRKEYTRCWDCSRKQRGVSLGTTGLPQVGPLLPAGSLALTSLPYVTPAGRVVAAPQLPATPANAYPDAGLGARNATPALSPVLPTPKETR